MKQKQLQQGDVLLKPIATIPSDAKKVKPTKGRLILAAGEVTGHHHAIEETSDAELYRIGEALILANTKPVKLKHEEHGPITVEPGIWEIGIVREYDYFTEMERKVQD